MPREFVKVLTAFTILMIGAYVLLYLYGHADNASTIRDCKDCAQLKEQAKSTKDTLLCSKIADEAIAAECRLEVLDEEDVEFALRYKDKKYCYRIETPQLMQECLFQLAVEGKDFAICEEMESTLRDSCYSEQAAFTYDADICVGKIQNDYYRDICLKKLALLKQEQKLCPQIKSESLRLSCAAEVLYQQKQYPRCSGLNEQECLQAEGCAAEYAPEDCFGCIGKVFVKCAPEKENLCRISGGEYSESCDCKGRAFINDFCIECSDVIGDLYSICSKKVLGA
ncbi:hypothetical protein HY501_01190 [Candidatus Woesearchaeota archaeon]|nr:hypothetical protein [Candidatus Woesearchaeota archaeon]